MSWKELKKQHRARRCRTLIPRWAGTTPPVIGIDLGHSSWRIGVILNNRFEMVATMPAIVALTDEGVLVGDEAEAQMSTYYRNTIVNLISLLGKDCTDVRRYRDQCFNWVPIRLDQASKPCYLLTCCGQEILVRPEYLLAYVFDHFKALVRRYLGCESNRCVLVLPVSFNQVRRALVVEAAYRAKWNTEAILSGSAASTVAYRFQLRHLGPALIINTGAGCTEITVSRDASTVYPSNGSEMFSTEAIIPVLMRNAVEYFLGNTIKIASGPEDMTKKEPAMERIRLSKWSLYRLYMECKSCIQNLLDHSETSSYMIDIDMFAFSKRLTFEVTGYMLYSNWLNVLDCFEGVLTAALRDRRRDIIIGHTGGGSSNFWFNKAVKLSLDDFEFPALSMTWGDDMTQLNSALYGSCILAQFITLQLAITASLSRSRRHRRIKLKRHPAEVDLLSTSIGIRTHDRGYIPIITQEDIQEWERSESVFSRTFIAALTPRDAYPDPYRPNVCHVSIYDSIDATHLTAAKYLVWSNHTFRTSISIYEEDLPLGEIDDFESDSLPTRFRELYLRDYSVSLDLPWRPEMGWNPLCYIWKVRVSIDVSLYHQGFINVSAAPNAFYDGMKWHLYGRPMFGPLLPITVLPDWNLEEVESDIEDARKKPANSLEAEDDLSRRDLELVLHSFEEPAYVNFPKPLLREPISQERMDVFRGRFVDIHESVHNEPNGKHLTFAMHGGDFIHYRTDSYYERRTSRSEFGFTHFTAFEYDGFIETLLELWSQAGSRLLLCYPTLGSNMSFTLFSEPQTVLGPKDQAQKLEQQFTAVTISSNSSDSEDFEVVGISSEPVPVPDPTIPLQNRLVDLFGQKLKSFSDQTILDIGETLGLLGRLSWSQVPRLYTVLRVINQLHLLDRFLAEGMNDLWFPFTHNRLPQDLAPSIRSKFLESQSVVFTKVFKFETFPERLHVNFMPDEKTPFETLALLGAGSQGNVDKVISAVTGRIYARKRLRRGPTFLKEKEEIKTFKNELGILKRLRHHHAVELVSRLYSFILASVANVTFRQTLT